MFERIMTGLHAALIAAFAVLAIVAVMFGRGFELLAARNGMGAWWFLAVWLLLSVVVALLSDSIVRWKVGLGMMAASLIVMGVAGVMQGAPLGIEMAGALSVLAALLVFSANRLQARSLKKSSRPQATAATLPKAVDWSRRLSWWVLSICMIEAFRLSHLGVGDQQKAIGCIGMLIAFFVMLPGLSVSIWFPRIASGCWLLSAGLLALIAWKSVNLSSAAGAASVLLCAILLGFATRRDTDNSELPQ
ncbi:MAG: hypothetical protein REI95_06675 [Oxalicibacterium faecigallinarum]|uniref:hypothetical protein n=1 Tax=Oxalicibacterium faecigallinarum TaxID=573741 RepID=UPI002808A376|nr:hypothetical protein [Oxalicibacterium faecigallinarum]MDQ7969312.1 hypothetical protein [Oxalicibacterium faecigallinarum]